jgi:hypothetical protein
VLTASRAQETAQGLLVRPLSSTACGRCWSEPETDVITRFITLNTWGIRGDWAARLPVFQEGFRVLDADIVTAGDDSC